MIRRCPRCGDPMELYYVAQRHCRRCQAEVQLLIEQDTARRGRRVWIAKSFDPYARVGRMVA